MLRRALLLPLTLLLTACGSTSSDARMSDPPPPAREVQEAQAAAGRGVKLVRVGRFESPVYLTAPRGDRRRLFVVEQKGRIMVVRGGRRLSRPFLDIRDLVTSGGEQGLLSVAFAPDYGSTGRFYVYYTDREGDQRIVEYRRATADRADEGTARLVLEMPDEEVNHNGGLLLFGPDDLMYVGTGDGGGGGDQHGRRGNAQNLGSLLGKILRIDPRSKNGRPYRIPSSNPFVGRSGARGEIYSYGLRNPWRFSFDRRTGDLSIGDVGQNEIEEVDFVRKGRGSGANFGWRPLEGRARYRDGEDAPGHVPPAIERTHSNGWCSITGGVIVRDRNVPGLFGRYVFGDFCKGEVLSASLRVPRARSIRNTGLRVPALSSFGEDASGRAYAISLEGSVFRFAAR